MQQDTEPVGGVGSLGDLDRPVSHSQGERRSFAPAWPPSEKVWRATSSERLSLTTPASNHYAERVRRQSAVYPHIANVCHCRAALSGPIITGRSLPARRPATSIDEIVLAPIADRHNRGTSPPKALKRRCRALGVRRLLTSLRERRPRR